jgi:Uma2 family endonuclease
MGAIEPPELLRRHRLTVDEYHRMGETGVLAPDARVELIDGEIVDMAPIGTRHGSTVLRLTHLMTEAARGLAIVSVQNSLRLGKRSEPQPDLMLLAPRDDFYAAAHPTAADVLLLIEVSDSTARYDREIKLPLYARHGVREVWIVDLDNRLLRTCRRPVGDGYSETVETAAPGVLSPEALPSVRIDASPLLG